LVSINHFFGEISLLD
jgi:hypothetical protein